MRKVRFSVFINPAYPDIKFGFRRVFGYLYDRYTSGICVLFLKKAFTIIIQGKPIKPTYTELPKTRVRFSQPKHEKN
jgi:hypothetical protein